MIEVNITKPFIAQNKETKQWYKQKAVQMKFEDTLSIPMTIIEDSLIEQEMGAVEYCIHKSVSVIAEEIAKLNNISDERCLKYECTKIMRDAMCIVMMEYYKYDRKKGISNGTKQKTQEDVKEN